MISRFLVISLIIEDQLQKVLPDYSSLKIFNGYPLPFNYTQLSAVSFTTTPEMYPEFQSNEGVFPQELSLCPESTKTLPLWPPTCRTGVCNNSCSPRGLSKHRCLGLTPRDPGLIVWGWSWAVVFFKSSPGDSKVKG